MHGGGEPGRRDRPAQPAGGEAVRISPRRAPWPEGDEHHSGGFRGAADRGRPSLCGRCAGAADRHGDRADGAAQGWQRVPDRAHAEPAGKRRGHPGDGSNPRHQRAQGGRKGSGADGGPVPRAAGGGAGCDGSGEPGRRDRPAQPAGGEAVRISPRRAPRPEGDEHHSGGFRGAADRGRPSLCGRRAGAADRHGDRADGAAQGWQRVPNRDHAEPAGKRRGHPGDGSDPRHQRAQGGRKGIWRRWRAGTAGCWRRRRMRWWW